jgi:hypothetical protein
LTLTRRVRLLVVALPTAATLVVAVGIAPLSVFLLGPWVVRAFVAGERVTTGPRWAAANLAIVCATAVGLVIADADRNSIWAVVAVAVLSGSAASDCGSSARLATRSLRGRGSA